MSHTCLAAMRIRERCRTPGVRVIFSAAEGESLWFSFLFRTNNASPLANQDFFQFGFDDNANASSGIPRVSIGANYAF